MKTYVLDAEFGEGPKGLPIVKCFVLLDVNENIYEFFNHDKLSSLNTHEAFNAGNRLVAYYAIAELQALRSLNVKVFSQIIDLFLIVKSEIPFEKIKKYSLLQVCDYFNIPRTTEDNKDKMRDLALRSGAYTKEEEFNLLEYCKSDVKVTHLVYEKIKHMINDSTIVWGEYLKLCCEIQYRGIPVKSEELNCILENKEAIKKDLIAENETALSIYEGTTFNTKNFKRYLRSNNISWYFTPNNKLDLSDTVFSKIKHESPELHKLGRIKHYLSSLRATKLKVEDDDRVYASLGPFGSRTGRNQPPGSKHILLHPSFFRGFISPKVGRAIIYIDYTQQEFGIAASLSNDEAMMEAYSSGDPYLYFAKLVGAAPANATKKTHPEVRSIYKQAILAVQYGMGSQSLATQINGTELQARKLLEDHELAFPTFWKWIRNYVDQSNLRGYCKTKWGWKLPLGSDTKTRTISNFPMQAGGSDILRQALFLLEENNIDTIAPLHDAVLIECDANEVEHVNQKASELLRQASRDYLNGFTLGVDSKIIKSNERFPVEKDLQTWNFIYSKIQGGVYHGHP